MPKKTFINLNEEKKKKIEYALVKEFSSKILENSTVESIVSNAGIARGSFYQYFESLEESYFYILEKEAKGVHVFFMKAFNHNNGDIIKALKDYEELLCDEIFNSGKYNLYKNRYLNWNSNLEEKWRKYITGTKTDSENFSKLKNNEEFNFVKSVVHSLIERLFIDGLSYEESSKIYKIHIKWIEGGIRNDENI